MKNLIFILGLLLSFSSFAQETDIKGEKNDLKFECDVVIYSSDKNMFEFNGKVSFKTDIIEIENADKIVFNQITKELTVTGLKDFTIDGAIQIKDKAEKKILTYTIGEKIAYLE